jgi:glycosyltransferase involved in cell wall biosynthesis
MLFSVLMAHFNNARFLEDSLKSVFDQTYTDWEIIVVDDGSTDDFENVISNYKNDSRIKVFRNGKNMGTAYTKAKCVEKANGEIQGFLDPDDLLHPDALKIMADAHAEMPSCSIIHSTHYICDDKMNIVKVAPYPKPLPEKTPYLLVGDGSIHHFVSYKKTSFDKSAGLSPIRAFDKSSDQELYYILEEQGDVFFINKPLHYYRIHQGSISNNSNVAIATIQHYDIIEKSCIRRITALKKSNQPDAAYWIKKYKTRYYKVRIFNSFRQKKWGRFIISLVMYPFVGGMQNLISYAKKLPQEGMALVKKSFVDNPQILDLQKPDK